MQPIEKVLVAMDFSAASRAALDHALGLAKEFGATVEVLHVSEPPRGIRPDLMVWLEANGNAVSVAEYAHSRAEEDLVKLIDGMGASLVRARVIRGRPASVIVDVATREGFDLIVIGTHGRTGVPRALVGSVAERVVRLARCPVLTVHKDQTTDEETSSRHPATG